MTNMKLSELALLSSLSEAARVYAVDGEQSGGVELSVLMRSANGVDLGVTEHGDVSNLTVDFTDPDIKAVQIARLVDDGLLSITLPGAGLRVVRLDITSDTGAHEWMLSSLVAPATPWGQDLDLMPPAGDGAVRSYWITAAPGRLDISWQDSWRV